jgi:hypothetical protein
MVVVSSQVLGRTIDFHFSFLKELELGFNFGKVVPVLILETSFKLD